MKDWWGGVDKLWENPLFFMVDGGAWVGYSGTSGEGCG